MVRSTQLIHATSPGLTKGSALGFNCGQPQATGRERPLIIPERS